MGCDFDLDWDDDEITSAVHYPDTDFLFTRMCQGTQELVAPQQGEWVLDVGCGKAVDALKLADSRGKVVGLDPSSRMLHEARNDMAGCSTQVVLLRGIGEALPFKRRSLDKVMCKGALDHFPDPEKSIQEMAEVLKAGGEAVIAIANFESLSCRLGRRWHSFLKLFIRGEHPRTPWEMPSDHTFKFDYPSFLGMVGRHFEVRSVLPVSLLWTAPYWGKLLSLMPRRIPDTLLPVLDKVARRVPSLSDVIIVKGTPRNV